MGSEVLQMLMERHWDSFIVGLLALCNGDIDWTNSLLEQSNVLSPRLCVVGDRIQDLSRMPGTDSNCSIVMDTAAHA